MKPQSRFAVSYLIAATVPFLSAFLFAATVHSSAILQQQPGSNAGQSAPEQLEPGKPIEKELSGGGSHSYQITLAEGQFLQVIVEQRGIDVVAQLLGPDGKLIEEFDSESRKQGQETVSQVAEMAGNYRLVVQAKQKEAPTGRYEIRVAELRAATEKDRALQEARKLHEESVRLRRAGKYEEARPLAERALEIREKALEPDHPDVAGSLNDLAILYRNKGDYAKAEPLYQRSLAIREKALGPEHPDVAASLNNLAILYRLKGDYAKAEPLHQRALAIWEKALGLEHPDVVRSLDSLARLYEARGEMAQAIRFQTRACAVSERNLALKLATGSERQKLAYLAIRRGWIG